MRKRKSAPLTIVFLIAIVSFALWGLLKLTSVDGIIDSDGDGIPDEWEIQYGLDPNDANDTSQDEDGDGYTNLQEYEAGTDPTSYLSYPPEEVEAYITVYSDSTLLSGVEISIDKLPSYSPYYIAFTNNDGIATFTDIESGEYMPFVRINDVWRVGTEITIKEGINYFIFYPDTWEVS